MSKNDESAKVNEEIFLRPQYASGVTWRSSLAILYGILVLQPAIIFLFAVVGQTMYLALAWILILLFVEVSRIFGVELSTQELYIIMTFEIYAALYSLSFIMLLRQSYVRVTPLGAPFGLAEDMPDWFAPRPGSVALLYRTFFHQDWLMPMMILGINLALSAMVSISLGFFTFRMFSEVEKLPFPMATAISDAIVTMGRRDESRLRVLTLYAVIGMMYGVLVYFVPFITGGAYQAIPIPWIDFNYYLQFVLPGASFGIATTLSAFAMGFIIPFGVVVWTFVGAFGVHVVGNHLLVRYGLWRTWAPETDVFFGYRESFVNFWLYPVLAVCMMTAFLPLIRHPHILTSSIRGFVKAGGLEGGREGQRMPSGKMLLTMYAVGSGGSVLLDWYLIPDFPVLYYAVITVGFTFLWTLVSANATASTGQAINIPYLYQAIAMGSGSTNTSVWFMPMPTLSEYWSPLWFFARGAGWCGSMKMADLCGVRLTELIKVVLLTAVGGLVMCLAYTQLLWWMAEIPSNVYLWLQRQWPVDATIRLWWTSKALSGEWITDWTTVIGAASVVTIAYAVSEALHLPFSLIGIAVGMNAYVPVAFSSFLGALLGRFLMPRLFGADYWRRNRSLVVAGLMIGEGTIVVVSSAIAMIYKALWVLPY